MNLLNDKNHYYFQKTEYYSLLRIVIWDFLFFYVG